MTRPQEPNCFPRSRTDILFGLLMRQLPLEITGKIWHIALSSLFSLKTLIDLINLNGNLDYCLSRVFATLELALYRLDSPSSWIDKDDEEPEFHLFYMNGKGMEREMISIDSLEFKKFALFVSDAKVRIKSLSLNAEVLDFFDNDESFVNFFQSIDDIKFHQSTSGALNYALKLGHLNLKYLSALDDINLELQTYLPCLEHMALQIQTHRPTNSAGILHAFPPDLRDLKIHYIVRKTPDLGRRLLDLVNLFNQSRTDSKVQVSLDFSAIGDDISSKEISNLVNTIKPINHTIRHLIITPFVSNDKFHWVDGLPNLKSITLDASQVTEKFEFEINHNELEELQFYDSVDFTLEGVSKTLKKLVLYNTVLPEIIARNLPESIRALEIYSYPRKSPLNQISFPLNLTDLTIGPMKPLPKIEYKTGKESCKLRNVELLKCKYEKNDLQDFIDELPPSVISLKMKPYASETKLNSLQSLQIIEVGNDDIITLDKLPLSMEYSYQPVILDSLSDIVVGYSFRELTVEILDKKLAGSLIKRAIENFEWLVSLKVTTKVGYLELGLVQSRELRALNIHFQHGTFKDLKKGEDKIVVRLIELPFTLNSFKINCDDRPKPDVQLHLGLITNNIRRSGVLSQVDKVVNINR